jgi:hypothetical protein
MNKFDGTNAYDHLDAMREMVEQNDRLLRESQEIISDLIRRVPEETEKDLVQGKGPNVR